MGKMRRGPSRISHTFLLRSGQVPAWLRQTAQFNPPRISNTYPVKLLALLLETGLAGQALTTARDEECEKCGLDVRVKRFLSSRHYHRLTLL